MKRSLLSTVAGAALLAAAFGCAHQQQQVKAPAGHKTAAAPAAAAAAQPALADGAGGASKEDAAVANGSIYFDYDATLVRDDAVAVLVRIAAAVRRQPGARVRIEGNCDERGTEEFNLALGQSRADQARRYLIRLGVPASRIDTVSYGKERPLDGSHDESAWSKNRRDDLKLQ